MRDHRKPAPRSGAFCHSLLRTSATVVGQNQSTPEYGALIHHVGSSHSRPAIDPSRQIAVSE